MTVFQLKQFASTSVHAAAGAVRWNYDKVEMIANGIVHAVGISFGLVAATVLVVLTSIYASPVDIVVVSVYVAGLLSMLILSATYNLWPVSPTKWVLRRFDHSAIYVLIAATYTPFIAALKDTLFSAALLLGVWGVAIFGIVLAAVPYAMQNGKRDFSSTTEIVARRYDVLCNPRNAERARDLLAQRALGGNRG